RMAAGLLEDGFRPPEELLMLQLLLSEAEQRPQMRAVPLPGGRDAVAEVERDEFLEVAEQVGVAEGATVVERELVLLAKEWEAIGAHPGGRDDGLGGVDPPVPKDLVDRPRHLLRCRNYRRIVESLGESHGSSLQTEGRLRGAQNRSTSPVSPSGRSRRA